MINGENVLSIQVHNLDAESSDLSFIPFFTFQQTNSNNLSNPPTLLQLPSSNIHTNFKIKSNGELIIISNSNWEIVDSVFTGFLPSNVSLGRQPDGDGDWFYFGQPTPSSSNTTSGSDSLLIVNDIDFSHEGGFYNSQLSLILSNNNENITIFYTIDGSIPNETSLVYNGPITINETTVIRGISVHDSGQRSEVITNTYFIDENRPLPVFSISTDPANLWADGGIYAGNFDREIPINIEMFETNGDLAFNHNAGAEIFGSGSSEFDQKSLSIFFRGLYGVGELDYKLFPDLPFEEYESFILRNGGNDWWSTLIRDAMTSTGLMDGTNLDYQAYRPSVVYLNGNYWGIHNIREKVNEHFIFDHHYVPKDSLDMIEYKEVITPEIIHGNLENYDNMIDFLNNNSLSITDNYSHAETMIDIDNFIDYQIIEIFCANIDWPANNNKFWRSKSIDGKWRWILYDTDTGFGLWDDWWAYGTAGWELDHFAHATNEVGAGSNEEGWPNPAWSTYIFRMLLQNDGFKNKFINRFADYLNTRFSSQNVLNVISNYKRGINNALPDHIERWGRSPGDYNEQIQKLNNFATFRPQIVRSQLVDHFNLDESVEITVKIEPSNSGQLKLNSLLISNSTWKGIYFKGSSMQLVASPNPGFKFSKWDGAISSDPVISIDPTDGMVITAMFELDSSGSIVINEINYNSNNTHNPGDWIELFNNNMSKIDLSGWTLNDAADSNEFIFPEEISIESGAYLVLSSDTNKFNKVFPDIDNTIGNFDFGLSSLGDTVRLFNHEKQIVDSLSYLSVSPWSISPNGNGPTLELINPNLDNNNPNNWASSNYLGTPGEQNSVFDIFAGEIIIIDEDESNYGLVQNYPNPFSSSTNIIYGVNNPSHVQLEIYNILGQKIITLVNEYQNPNEYIVNWNGLNYRKQKVSSGIYIYILKLNFEVAQVKKMVKL